MPWNTTKPVEEVILALLGAFEFENGRVWKRYDFATMDALHTRGLTEPHGRQESVRLTDEGLRLAKAACEQLFRAAPKLAKLILPGRPSLLQGVPPRPSTAADRALIESDLSLLLL